MVASREKSTNKRSSRSRASARDIDQVTSVPGDSFRDIGDPDPDDQYRAARFETALMRTSRRVRRVYDAGLREVGLNLSEVNLLVIVLESGPMSQTQLAERYGIGRARAGAVVDRLEAKGLLNRVPDESDRRVWLVESTPLTSKLVKQINKIDAQIRSELRAGLSDSDRIHLARTLAKIAENLEPLEARLAE